jgi:hypothetical protein
MNGTDEDQQGGQFVANVGDQIRLEVGTDSRLVGSGIGNAATSGLNRLSVSIGACAQPAPMPLPPSKSSPSTMTSGPEVASDNDFIWPSNAR